jgi:hypothetical protein
MKGLWMHCSPELLANGVDCASAPRSPCHCQSKDFVGHDHFISAPLYIGGEKFRGFLAALPDDLDEQAGGAAL